MRLISGTTQKESSLSSPSLLILADFYKGIYAAIRVGVTAPPRNKNIIKLPYCTYWYVENSTVLYTVYVQCP